MYIVLHLTTGHGVPTSARAGEGARSAFGRKEEERGGQANVRRSRRSPLGTFRVRVLFDRLQTFPTTAVTVNRDR